MNSEIVDRIRESFRAVEKASAEEPLIYFDEKGGYWLNDHARSFISQKKIPLRDFMEWLLIGSSHLQNLSYGEVEIRMMRMPKSGVVAFLSQGDADEKTDRSALTAKEREVLRYIVKGFTNKRIANFMKISPGTVNSHLDNIYEKLGCSSRVAAGFLGLKKGLFLPVCDKIEKTKD